MISLLVLFLQLVSGSVFAAVFYKQKFEKTITYTFFGIVFFLFIFGFFGCLLIGLYIIFVLTIVMYLSSGIKLLIKPDFKCFIHSFFSPGFFMFSALYVFLIIIDRGKMAYKPDEFSHWMDSIKVMIQLNDFIASPLSNSTFPSYPPAMTIFQYFVQSSYRLFNPEAFSEWRMYLAYQLFAASVFFPLLSSDMIRTPGRMIISLSVIALCPILFYSDFYHSVFIDAFIGILTGAGFYFLYINRNTGTKDIAYFALLTAVLSISKDVGKYFSCILILNYLVILAVNMFYSRREKTFSIKKAANLFSLLLTPLAIFMWKNVLARNSTRIRFDNPIDLIGYTRLFFLHDGTDYKQEVADNIKNAFFSKGITRISGLGVAVSYFSLILIFAIAFLLIIRSESKEMADRRAIKQLEIIAAFALIQAIAYTYSLGAVYIANFIEYEATTLASYDRYMNMAFLPVWICIVFIVLTRILNNQSWKVPAICLVLIILFVSPVDNLIKTMDGTSLRDSLAYRQKFQPITEQIEQVCDGNASILYIAQEKRSTEYFTQRYISRPNNINGRWSIIGEKGGTFYDGDLWTRTRTVEQLRNLLISDYDYLALYCSNAYFREYYSELFTDDIIDNTLYTVDKKTGHLSMSIDLNSGE